MLCRVDYTQEKISFNIYDSNYSRDKIHTVRASNINRVACSSGQQPGQWVGAGWHLNTGQHCHRGVVTGHRALTRLISPSPGWVLPDYILSTTVHSPQWCICRTPSIFSPSAHSAAHRTDTPDCTHVHIMAVETIAHKFWTVCLVGFQIVQHHHLSCDKWKAPYGLWLSNAKS